MFQVGECIVYGMNGVCRVDAVGSMSMSGVDSDKQYYTLTPIYAKGKKVFTPVDNKKVIMRSVITKEEALQLIDDMKNMELIEAFDDKCRELAYKESMKTCDCRAFVRIMNTVLKRKQERQLQGKKLSACDERYYKQAQENLCEELAVSLGIEKSEVEELIGRQHSLKNIPTAS